MDANPALTGRALVWRSPPDRGCSFCVAGSTGNTRGEEEELPRERSARGPEDRGNFVARPVRAG